MRWKLKTFVAGIVAISAAALYGPVSRAGVSCSVPFTFQNNTTADATQVNANFTAIISCLTNAAAAGINSDITQLIGLTTPLSPSLGGTAVFVGGTTTGSANAQVLASTTPNNFALTSGYRVTFIAGFSNSSTLTLNVHSTGALTVYRKTQLQAQQTLGNEVIAGNPYTVVYNGSAWIIDGETQIVGAIRDFPSNGNLGPCLATDGSAISRTTYSALYSLIGTTYGVGDGVTTFNIPDYRGRNATMQDTNRISNACGSSNTIGTACGAQTQTISQGQLPNVNFSVTDPGHAHGGTSGAAILQSATGTGSGNLAAGANVALSATTASSQTGITVNSGGSGNALITLPPTLIAYKVICY